MRRQLGPAYERSPAENVGDWATNNVLILISALVTACVFWWLVNWVVGDLLNFLVAGTDDNLVTFNPDDFTWVTVKIIGSLVLVVVICSRTAK